MSIVRSSAQVRIPDAMNGDKDRMGSFGSVLEQLLDKNPDCFTGLAMASYWTRRKAATDF
jgi:hypothetical protein